MELTRLEKETIVNYNEEEPHAEVYTRSALVMRKLDKLCERFPDTYTCIKRNSEQATYHCPKDRVSFRPPTSEAQRSAGKKKALSLEKHRRLTDAEDMTASTL